MLKDLDLDLLERSPHQALKPLRPQDLLSVRKVGLAEPIIVRPLPSPSGQRRYQILRGERWWRIAGLLGYGQVPAIVRSGLPEREALAIAASEDEHTEDPIAEARALRDLLISERMTISRLARSLGRTRTALSHLLRLLKLEPSVQSLVQEGKLAAGVARALVTLPASTQLELAQEAIAQQLSARDIESRARAVRQTKSKARLNKPATISAPTKSADTRHLESALSTLLGCQVQLDEGKLSIHYQNLEVLDGILERLGYGPGEEWD